MFLVGPSTTLMTYVEDSETRQGCQFSLVCHLVNGLNSNDLYETILIQLGIDPVMSYTFYHNGIKDFSKALETLKCKEPSMTLEDMARIFDNKNVHNVANLLRDEDQLIKENRQNTQNKLEIVDESAES